MKTALILLVIVAGCCTRPTTEPHWPAADPAATHAVIGDVKSVGEYYRWHPWERPQEGGQW